MDLFEWFYCLQMNEVQIVDRRMPGLLILMSLW